MAGSKDYAVLDLQDKSDSLSVDLQFQGIRTTAYDFGETRTQSSGGGGQHEQTITFSDFPDTPDEELEQEKLLGEGEEDDDKPIGLKKGTGFWTFEFYQQFFDVESKQVGDRILWSMVPKPGVSYLQSYIRPNPDLYGPFWICMTLTFTTAITGNLANYLGTRPEESYVWRYDFHKVTLAATAIFSYAWLVPLAMWGVLVWRGSRAKISLLELLCIYGYSLAIFVPVSILWIVPQPWFKWCLAIVAPVLSGSVLVRTVWPSLSHDAKQVAIGIAVFILVLHATLALGFMLYFFAAPERAQSNVIPGEPVKADVKNEDSPPPTTKRHTVEENEKVEGSALVAAALHKDPGGDKVAATDKKAIKNPGEVAVLSQQKSLNGSIAKKSVSMKSVSEKPAKKPLISESTSAPAHTQSDAKMKGKSEAIKKAGDVKDSKQGSKADSAKSIPSIPPES
ncbi:protein YIPF1-like isoform X3 [Macrobrachium rosenbergii]|uniref:protein YIPF1-like isoform X3 n=1 Tax=Macrobrachium rosenbergii TaxID=79674 RepID=UPI0034D5DAA3